MTVNKNSKYSIKTYVVAILLWSSSSGYTAQRPQEHYQTVVPSSDYYWVSQAPADSSSYELATETMNAPKSQYHLAKPQPLTVKPQVRDSKHITKNPEAPFKWTGLYIGGYFGGAWGHSDFNTDTGQAKTPQTPFTYFISNENINSVNQSGSVPLNASAFIGGVQAGYNRMLDIKPGYFVYGLVLDVSSFSLSKTNLAEHVQYPSTAAGVTYTLQTSMSTDWLFTARGRAGIAANNSLPLIYATGGLAVTRLDVTNFFADNNVFSRIYSQLGGGSQSSTKTGWTVGAGVEYPITDYLTINSEYLYVDFNDGVTVASNIAGGFNNLFMSPFITSANLNANLFKVGVNYLFA